MARCMTNKDRALAIQGIVFDKDGTLIDFQRTWVPALLDSARDLALTVGREDMADAMLAAVGGDAKAGKIFPGTQLASGTTDVVASHWCALVPELPPATEVIEWLDDYWSRATQAALHPVTELRPLIETLRRRMAIGLATNDAEEAAHLTLRRLGVSDLFDLVHGYDSGHGAKPEPGMILEFCRRTGLAPSRVAMVGDSPADLNAGRAAGCGLVIAVLTGASRADLLAPLADHVLPSIADLPTSFDL